MPLSAASVDRFGDMLVFLPCRVVFSAMSFVKPRAAIGWRKREKLMSGNGKIAIVTGAGSGIGRASAIALLQDGWTVTLAGRRQDPLEETASLAGGRWRADSWYRPTSAMKTPCGNLFDATKEAFGRLDFLFNNAGMGVPPPIPTISPLPIGRKLSMRTCTAHSSYSERLSLDAGAGPEGRPDRQ